MKFYIILLRYHKVVDICSFDEEGARDRTVKYLQAQMREWSEYDEVQTLNVVT